MGTSRRTSSGLTLSQERELSAVFGKHISPPKALLCFLASTLLCLSPMLLGLRLWSLIPPVVETGLLTADGRDDSLPSAVLIFGIPGLFAVLNLICHGQLWLHQKARRIPPTQIRILGRWGIPPIALFLSCFWILRAAGEQPDISFFLPCILSLLLVLLGAHFFDCDRESRLAFHLKSVEHWETPWRKTHRLAGICWMLAGFLILLIYLGTDTLSWYSLLAALLLMLLPLPASSWFSRQSSSV